MSVATFSHPMLGPIEPDVVYPLPDFMARAGLGDAAMRTARKSGLAVKYAGGRGYVLGRDFIEWLNQNAKESR